MKWQLVHIKWKIKYKCLFISYTRFGAICLNLQGIRDEKRPADQEKARKRAETLFTAGESSVSNLHEPFCNFITLNNIKFHTMQVQSNYTTSIS